MSETKRAHPRTERGSLELTRTALAHGSPALGGSKPGRGVGQARCRVDPRTGRHSSSTCTKPLRAHPRTAEERRRCEMVGGGIIPPRSSRGDGSWVGAGMRCGRLIRARRDRRERTASPTARAISHASTGSPARGCRALTTTGGHPHAGDAPSPCLAHPVSASTPPCWAHPACGWGVGDGGRSSRAQPRAEVLAPAPLPLPSASDHPRARWPNHHRDRQDRRELIRTEGLTMGTRWFAGFTRAEGPKSSWSTH